MKNSFRYLLISILLMSFSDCFARWILNGPTAAHIYYAENIIKGKIIEASCVKDLKMNWEKCAGTLELNKLYKGNSELIGKVVHFENESFSSHIQFFKKGEERILLFDNITAKGKLVPTHIPSGGFPAGIDVGNESDLQETLKEQNNPKYRPPLDPTDFYGREAWVANETVNAESVFVVKTTNVFNMFLHIDKILRILPCWYHHTVEIEKVLRGDKNLVGKKLLLNDNSPRYRLGKCEPDFSENERSLLVFRKSDKKRDYSKILEYQEYEGGIFNTFKGEAETGESFFKLCEKNPWYQPPKDARKLLGD